MAQKSNMDTAPGDGLVVHNSSQGKGERPRAQLRRPSRTGWTDKKRAKFLNVLKSTSNVKEAARTVRLDVSGAYALRKRDAAFAAEWAEALEQGYAELEMLLLRQSIHGSETTEIIDDGKPDGVKRTKTVHSYPHGTALRLMLAHKGAVDAYRHKQGIDRPGSEDVRMEIQRRIETVRLRIGAPSGAGNAADTGHSGDEPERDDDA